MFYLNTLIRENQKPLIKRNNFLRLDKNERNFRIDNKFFKKINKAVTDTLIQSYPENIDELKELLAKKEKIDSKYISITPGADGALKYIFELLKSNKNKNVSSLFPTYAMLEVYTKIFQFKLTKVIRPINKKIISNDFIKKNTKLVYIANPNMPDGQVIEKEQILKLIKLSNKKNFFLIIDETYIDFSNYKSLKNLVPKNKNLIVIKSFSKSLGLAGLRLGYLIANSNILKLVNKIRPLADISSLSAEIALILLRDNDYKKKYINEIKKSKKLVKHQCKKLNLKLIETETNFFHLIFERKTDKIQKILKKNKILVRKNKIIVDNIFKNTLRVTYSNKKNMNFFFKKLKLILKKK